VALVGVLRESGVCARYARVEALGDPHLVGNEHVLEGASIVTREHDGRVLGTIHALGHCKNGRLADHSSCALHHLVRPSCVEKMCFNKKVVLGKRIIIIRTCQPQRHGRWPSKGTCWLPRHVRVH